MDLNQTFGPSDIVSATGGNVSLADLRNWARDDRFNTRLAEPRAGKPRDFPLSAVIEAILLREFSSYGVALDRAKAWNREILSKIEKQGLATVAPNGSQYGPGGHFPGPIVVLFHSGGERIHFGGAGAIVDAFYEGRDSGPAPSLAAIHLPALLSPSLRSLGVRP